eukprot:23694-Amphidinium_carterae.2
MENQHERDGKHAACAYVCLSFCPHSVTTVCASLPLQAEVLEDQDQIHPCRHLLSSSPHLLMRSKEQSSQSSQGVYARLGCNIGINLWSNFANCLARCSLFSSSPVLTMPSSSAYEQ